MLSVKICLLKFLTGYADFVEAIMICHIFLHKSIVFHGGIHHRYLYIRDKHTAMDTTQYFDLLISKLPDIPTDILNELKSQCELISLEKGEPLIAFQSTNRKIYCIVQGSFVRNIITSRGEEKTVMFHTESFCEFFKSYDSVYFHQKTNYEVKANEKSAVIAVDYDFFVELIQNHIELLKFYTHKTEELFLTVDLFRNFQLGLTSEEYLKWLYENYSFLFLRFPGQNIASFMGITNVWLSNLKAKITF